jgi:oxygen-independent coproporphyrinogen-3 oxidase
MIGFSSMNLSILDEIPPGLFDRYLGPTVGHATAGEVEVKVNGIGPDEYARTLRNIGFGSNQSLALYLHVPFCAVRCHFCACNTNVTHDAEQIDDYLDTLEREMDLVVATLGEGRQVRQLHVGGGTPNHLSDEQLVRLVEIVHQHFQVAEDACVCIECNPRRASARQMELLQGLGFGWISLGVQDLSLEVQRAIGRIQSEAVIRDVCQMAREVGFQNINIDLIHGLPDQTEKALASTLEQVISLRPDRIRCFSYAHAPARRPNQLAINSQSLPSPTEKISLFGRVVKELTQAGYTWIGADCFAGPRDEWTLAQAEGRLRRNSMGYTAAPTDYQLACGPHGLGEVGSLFVQNEPSLAGWTRAVRAGRLPIAWGHRLGDEDFRRRRVYEHLLCNLVLPASTAKTLGADLESLGRCVDDGLLEMNAEGIRVTERGRFFLESLCSKHASSLDWDSAQWLFPKSR